MKDAGVYIVLAFLVLAALILMLFLGPLAEKPGMRGVEDNPLGAAPPPGKRTGGATPQPPSSSDLEQVAAGSPGEPGRAAPAAGSAARHRFPSAADVPSGMDRAKLEALFGRPSMHTVSVEQGTQFETYIYVSREPEAATFVLLRSGRVISATTTSY